MTDMWLYPEYWTLFIMMSRCKHGSPWPSLATRLYCPLFLVSLQGYILYQHRAVVYRFWLVVLPLLVHMKGSTGVCCLWVCFYFSSRIYIAIKKKQHLTMCKKNELKLVLKCYLQNVLTNHIYLISMYK